MKKILISIILLVFSSSSLAQTVTKPSIDGGSATADWDLIATDFQKRFKLVLDNFDKIWYEGFPDLEVQLSNGERAWKITRESVNEYRDGEKPEFRNASFGFEDASKNGKPILQFVIAEQEISPFGGGSNSKSRLRQTIEQNAVQTISQFVFHEAFHFYVQSKLHLKDQNNESDSANRPTNPAVRDTSYPVDPMPRIYRNNIYFTLLKALENEKHRTINLRNAKYWHMKYNELYPQEALGIRETDITEGTAEYVGEMAEAYATYGFNANRKKIHTHFLGKAQTRMLLLSLDTESYRIGLIAGILSDDLKLNWKRKVLGMNKRLTPLEVLLENVESPKKKPLTRFGHIKTLKAQAKEKNKMLAEPMKVLMAIYKGTFKDKLLMVPFSKGSYGRSGSYTHSKIPESSSLMFGLEKNVIVKDGNIQIDQAIAIDLEPIQNVCGYRAFTIIPLTLENQKKVKINAETIEKTSVSGMTFQCVKPKED